ncbi:MAG: glycoside hydrolase/phage tail family protein [Rhizobiales bacterium]|nr:glycoside hydrolase/phage tail family protein [Hyphomicrobiales bacterium]
MDVARGNTLPNPYNGFGTQPSYPWRGRITCDPAPLAQNYQTRTDDLTVWNQNATPVVTGGQADPFGGTEACKVEDNDTANSEALTRTAGGTWAAGDKIFCSVYVKQDVAETKSALLQVYTKASAPNQYVNLTLNVATGALTVTNTANVTVLSSGVETVTAPDGSVWYRPWAVISDSVNANAPFMWLYPAAGGASFTGIKTFYGPQIAKLGARVEYYRNAATSPVAAVDRTATATTQVASFFGAAAASDITVSVNGSTNVVSTSYSDPAEWSFRRFILHCAKLCKAINSVDAGAVDGFLIGSELKGLTTIRDGATSFPAVSKLKTLAADVKTILGAGVKVGYAADWSEYNSYAPADGSGDLYFHLDPLWSDSNIDFVGVDLYVPLSDWRDGASHLDAANYSSIYDPNYLKSNIEGGEDYDWYYASQNARDTQVRTTISDGAYGKPWVWRAKDFRNWWSNAHYDRPGGVQSGTPTAWVAQSKPIWFTEFGVPSIDKGSNEPNVFYDPKSSESAVPYYSKGTRDDLIQRRGIEALLSYWAANNPTSSVYGGPMIGLMAAWTWDARPYPAWPALTDVWGDTALWPYGHWLNGKVGLADLAALVAERCQRVGFAAYDVTGLAGVVVGYVRDRPMSPRAEIELLMNAYSFDAVESEGVIRFVPRGRPAVASFQPSDCVLSGPGDLIKLTRAQETDLPDVISVTFVDGGKSYRPGTVAASRIAGYSDRKLDITVPLVMDQIQAQTIASRLLAEAWIARETAAYALPPDQIALDAGDVINLVIDGSPRAFRLTRINDAWARSMEAQRCESAIYVPALPGDGSAEFTPPPAYGAALLELMDLPLLQDTDVGFDPYAAVSSSPFAGVTLLDSATGTSFAVDTDLPVMATMGETLSTFAAGPTAYFDTMNTLSVKLYSGALASASQGDVLSGRVNALAIEIQIDGALAERNVARFYKWGPSGVSQSDPAWQQETFTARCVGLMPWSPVHVAGNRNVSGDLAISWIRRTRFGGVWTDGTDVPLNEETESYSVDILNGTTVVRTIAVAAPSASYTAAQQVTDFGSAQSAIAVKIYQLSATVGRGRAASATL